MSVFHFYSIFCNFSFCCFFLVYIVCLLCFDAVGWAYIWHAEMTKVIFRCLLLDWNHWMMNFYFYLWLLNILWLENTSSHISRHLEFITEQGPLGLRVAGFPGHWVLGHKMSPLRVTHNRRDLGPLATGTLSVALLFTAVSSKLQPQKTSVITYISQYKTKHRIWN